MKPSDVMPSEAECEGMVETLHLLRSPANAERLLRSIKSAGAGKLAAHEIEEKPVRRK